MSEPAAPPPDEAAVAAWIGRRLRELRAERGWSMRTLSARAGVSQPFLSQLERGLCAPSMVTTYRLAHALEVSPGQLVPAMTDAATAPVVVVRADEGRRMPVSDRHDSAAGRVLRLAEDSPLQVVEYVVKPGEHLDEWFEAIGDTGIYVMAGCLEVEVEHGETTRLGARDFLSFPSGTRERWRVVGDEPASVLLSVAMLPRG